MGQNDQNKQQQQQYKKQHPPLDKQPVNVKLQSTPEVTEPTVETQDVVVETEVVGQPQQVYETLESVSMEDYTVSTLEDYQQKIKIGTSTTQQAAAKANESLFSLFKLILEKEQAEFSKEWNKLLMVFDKYSELTFNERMLFRYPEYWTKSHKDFNLYRVVATLAIATANVSTRSQNLKSLNLDKLASTGGLTPSQMQKIIAFYG